MSGADGVSVEGVLRCSLETFFDSRPGDDMVAVAEAEGRLQRSLFVPEAIEVLAQTLELGGEGGVVTLRKVVPQLGTSLARLIDLLVDLGEGHVVFNDLRSGLIPGGR